MPNPVQYSLTVDPIIYCEASVKLERNDWLEVAKAALDQALHIDEEPVRKQISELIDALKSA